MKLENLVQILQDIELFKHLDEEKLIQISKFVDIVNYNENEILFYENETKDKFYYLLEGELKLYKVDRFDNEIFLYRLSSNNMVSDFIDVVTLKYKKCFANAVFNQNSKLLCINHQFFVGMMLNDMIMYKKFIKEVSVRIANLESIIKRDVVFDATAKVAHMIVTSKDRFNSLKKHEIAYELHIQPETLSRILAKMSRNSLIQITKNKVEIINLDALREIYD